MLFLHAKTPKFAPARGNELKLWGLGYPEGHLLEDKKKHEIREWHKAPSQAWFSGFKRDI